MKHKLIFRVLIPLVLACFLGLLAAQVIWFRDALQLKEEQFQDKAFVLINQAGMALAGNQRLSTQLRAFLEDHPAGNTQNAGALSTSLGSLLDSVFIVNGFGQPFHFSIFQGCDSEQVLLSDLPVTEAPVLPTQFSESLGCFIPDQMGGYFLGLHFPRKNRYLWQQVGGMLGLSLVLILLMLAASAYMLWLIHRQKKISDIKNDFINNLTHEFKTPIASIALAAKVMLQNKKRPKSPEEQSYLQLIRKESKRLENQVDKILQMAIVDTGNFALEKKSVDLHELLEKVVDSCTLFLQEKQGTIRMDFQAQHPVVKGDPAHLFNLFYNLLDNAIKYSREKPEITLTTREEADGFSFSIRDNGIGIKEELQRNIFEKFYRAEAGSSRQVKGFGLGLSYVKSIVEAHRGRISFESVINEGTEFRVLLPFG